MSNIVLVGFMGTGKTMIGKALAKSMSRTYVSTDDMVERREAKSINKIFVEDGEEYFRRAEKEVVKVVADQVDQVIDTGGGVIMDPENVDALKRNGIVICLWANPEVIMERTKHYTHRPLLNVGDPKARIEELLAYRKPYYDKADFHVDTSSGDVDVIVKQIMKLAKTERLERFHPAGAEYSSRLWKLSVDKLLLDTIYPVVIVDNKGVILFTNRRYLEYFGMTAKDVLGKNWIDLTVPEYAADAARKIFEEVKNREAPAQFELPITSREFGEKYFAWISSILKKGGSTDVMIIGCPDKPPKGKIVEAQPAVPEEVADIIFAGSITSAPDTAKHSLRVTSFAVCLAKKIGLDKESIDSIKVAALLHDVGKIAVDEGVLLKKGKLEDFEWEEIKKHPGWSVDMVKPVTFLKHVLPMILNHHENWDGSGYPNGLSGEEIPIGARILAVADIYEALTADRPYRKAFSKEEAIEIMKKEKATKLDPRLTDIFIEMVQQHELNGEDI